MHYHEIDNCGEPNPSENEVNEVIAELHKIGRSDLANKVDGLTKPVNLGRQFDAWIGGVVYRLQTRSWEVRHSCDALPELVISFTAIKCELSSGDRFSDQCVALGKALGTIKY